MPRSKHYSPAIDRFLVRVLYHKAKQQKKPMTVVTNELLTEVLKDSEAWRIAEESDGGYRTAGDSNAQQ